MFKELNNYFKFNISSKDLRLVLKLFIILLFSAIYLPHCFIIIEDFGLISGYEVDAGSLISSMESLLNKYNMNKSYHSKYYGWSYLSINYFIIKIAIFISNGYILEHKIYLYFLIRFTLFLIGLASAIVFCEVVLRIFKSCFLALIASILYIFNFIDSYYFYMIHPETTGVLFLLLSLLCLIKINEDTNKHIKYYFLTLVFLVIASLSKQIFFIISLPILAVAVYKIFIFRKESLKIFLHSSFFRKITIYTPIISIFILLLIHPHFLFKLKDSIGYQIEIKNYFTSDGVSYNFSKSFLLWINLFLSNKIFLFFIITFPFAIFVAIKQNINSRNFNYSLFLFNSFALVAITLMIFSMNRVYIVASYLYPISPFFILYIISIISFLKNRVNKAIYAKILCFVVLILLSFFIFISVKTSLNKSLSRYNAKESISYLSYTYILKNAKDNEKFVYDHFVAFPSSMGKRGCHYWQGCGVDYIEEYNPDYVIFNDKYSINGKMIKETERLIRYVSEHNMKLYDTILSKKDGITLLIYKKR